VILVSDGKETCKGDPCLTAKALAEADGSLIIHTIGFAADSAAKYQLQCIARWRVANTMMPTTGANLQRRCEIDVLDL
jgi:hypothetical protein